MALKETFCTFMDNILNLNCFLLRLNPLYYNNGVQPNFVNGDKTATKAADIVPGDRNRQHVNLRCSLNDPSSIT